MSRNNALKVLGFAPGENPSEKDIKKHYTDQVRQVHPDKIQYPELATEDEKAELLKKQTERFQALQDAYEVLKGTSNVFDQRAHLIIKISREPRPHECFTVAYEEDLEKFKADLANVFEEQKYATYFYIEFYGSYKPLIIPVRDQLLKHECFYQAYGFDPFLRKTPFSPEILQQISKRKVWIEQKRNATWDTPQQRAARINTIQERRASRKEDYLESKNEIFSPLYYEGIFSFVAFAAVAVLGLQFALIAASVGGILGFLRRQYLIKSSDDYDFHDEVLMIKTPSEIEALKMGIEAVTWKGYFTSFKNFNSYKHPMAFSGAYVQAAIENEEVVETIRDYLKI